MNTGFDYNDLDAPLSIKAIDETKADWSKPSRCVVVDDGNYATILHEVGPHLKDAIDAMGSRDADELLGDVPLGISIWEGRYVGGGQLGMDGDYSDPELKGEFRPATMDELGKIVVGESLWDANDWLLKLQT